ncbi:Rho GTPase-activating protein 5 [Taenia solium]|eukprot:TsM_000695700 transcript=TsM_000695700 gene=TsM_000695700
MTVYKTSGAVADDKEMVTVNIGTHQSDADLIPTYTVSIIGDPRSGKSCFCNRFVYSHPDWYQEGHPSVLSEEDFCKPVVNSDHWLYWGTVTRRLDDETSVRFCVIEQTEFLSDTTSLPFSPKSLSTSNSCATSYSPHSANAVAIPGITSTTNCAPLPLKEFHSSDRLHEYILRSTATKICSPGKLRYYCIDQLGHEECYKQEYFPHVGPFEVHGFLVIYDVSRRASCQTPDLQQQQLAFLIDVLSLISKRKKPVVVVAAKRDNVDEQCLSSVTQFLQKSADFRKIPVVETSAHKNINVELAFLTLARLLDNSGNSSKSRSAKLKLLSYQEATREQDEHQRRLREAFVNRVSLSPAGFLTDWPTFLSRYSHQGDVARFIDLWGSEVARETFEQFTAQRKTETKRRHMAKLPEALSTMLLYVGPVTNNEELPDDNLIQRRIAHRSLQGDDSRIPFALALKEPPDNGDSPFMESLKSLVFAESWATNMAIFEAALLQWQASSSASGSFASILPGQSFDNEQLSRIQPASVLSQEDQLEVYQKFQECLRLNTREEFLDLLLENLPQFIRAASAYLSCLGDTIFTTASSSSRQLPANTASQPRFEPSRSRPISPVSEPLTIPLRSVQLPPADIRLCSVLAPPRGAKEQQLVMIKNCIASDSRYHAMDYMSSERQTCLTSHLDILLHRARTEASPLLLPPSTIHRHYSCSFMDQQDSLQLTFPLSHCPAYQTGWCMDTVFEKLCSDTRWSVADAQNSFSSHLSCVLGQGDKRLCVAVCAVCTDVIAANAGINLFRAAGFVPEGANSPSLLTSSSSPFRTTQNLISSWPLASTILTPVDTLIASVIGDSVISPVLGTVQASFLSHHELLTLATNPRRSPDVFDGVILLLSTDETTSLTSRGAFPPCTCGKGVAATYCCKCYRGAPDCSHTTPRPRSLFSRVTAIKTLAEHLAPVPHLIVLAVTRNDTGAKMNICHGSENLSTLPFSSTAESSPQASTTGARLSDLLVDGTKNSIGGEEAENDVKETPILGGVFHPTTKLRPNFVLDALSDFLSACWTSKLASCEGGHRPSRKSISPRISQKARGYGRVTTARSSNRLNHRLLALTSTLDPLTGYCSSIASSCSPCPVASSFPSLVPFTCDKASPASSPEPTFLKFSEGLSPIPPDGIDPATPFHVLSLRERWLQRKRNEARWVQVKNGGNDGEGEEKWENEEIFLQFGAVHLVPCPHIYRSTDNSQEWTAPTTPHCSMVKQHPVGKKSKILEDGDNYFKSLDLGSANRGGLNQHHCSHNHQHQTSSGGVALATTSATVGGVSSFLTSGIRAVTSGFGRPRERRRSISTPCGGEEPLSLLSTTANGMTIVGGGAATVISASNTPPSSTLGSARAADLVLTSSLPGPETPLRTGTGVGDSSAAETTSKASTPPFPFEEADGLSGSGDGELAAGEGPLLPRLWVSSLHQLMELASASRSSSEGEKEVAVTNEKRGVLISRPRHWHLPSCPHRLCIPRQNLLPPPPSSLSSLSTSRRHPISNTNVPPSSTKRSSFNNHHHCRTDAIAAPPPESRHLPANTTDRPYSTSQYRIQYQQRHQLSTASLSGFQGGRRSVVDLPTSSACLDAGQSGFTNPPTSSRSTTCLAAAVASLSLFGGKTNAFSSEPQQQQNNTHASTSAAVTSSSGGASFPSTPVHESSTATTITAPVTLAFGHLKAKSTSPPLSNATSSPCSSPITSTANSSS